MEYIAIYIALFAIIIIIGEVFNKSFVPSALLLVITGMLLSFIPRFPRIDLNPKLVLNFFLPLLIYHISHIYSWRDLKKNALPIAFLSVGHVVFITVLVAILFKCLIPDLTWPITLVLGAVVSPLDDVALVAIAGKIRLPERVINILKGEGMLNDSTALILFRFSLLAVVTHQFAPLQIISTFCAIIAGEIFYGVALGYCIGKLRLLIREPALEVMASLLTPFLAFFPAEHLGGCGVLATVVTGLTIEKNFAHQFSPEIRIYSRSVWSTVSFAVEGLLFLLVGLEMRFIVDRISYIPISNLVFYSTSLALTVIIGRFIWVFTTTYLPALFSFNSKKAPPPWQHTFIISWSGMRGGISLAAALAVPALPTTGLNRDPSDLLVFLVFSLIVVTLILQGLALPLVLRTLGLIQQGQHEKHLELLSELKARETMARAVLDSLQHYRQQVLEDEKLLGVIDIRIQEYVNLRNHLQKAIKGHDTHIFKEEESELKELMLVSSQITEVERLTLLNLWDKEKINIFVKNKILNQLDRRSRKIIQ